MTIEIVDLPIENGEFPIAFCRFTRYLSYSGGFIYSGKCLVGQWKALSLQRCHMVIGKDARVAL
jgi:hypothetical protein